MPGNSDLIAEYQTIHATTGWGGTSVKNLRFIRPLLQTLRPTSIIDYGCGKSVLLDELKLPGLGVRDRFDPAIPEFAAIPDRTYDVLINVDVLEHIPEEELDGVLTQMAGLSKEAILIVDTRPAALTLADGRNAHVSLHDHHWWQERLQKHFGPLQPFKVARQGRAAFFTWQLTPLQKLNWAISRLIEKGKYLLRRASGKKY